MRPSSSLGCRFGWKLHRRQSISFARYAVFKVRKQYLCSCAHADLHFLGFRRKQFCIDLLHAVKRALIYVPVTQRPHRFGLYSFGGFRILPHAVPHCVYKQRVPSLAHFIHSVRHLPARLSLRLGALVSFADTRLQIADPLLEECLYPAQQARVCLRKALAISLHHIKRFPIR